MTRDAAPLLQDEEIDLFDAVLRTDLPSFIAKVFHTLNPTLTYHDNWHIHAIAHVLELVRLGVITRLIITMPPRSLKSICASIAFPAFLHGHDPSLNLICASYAQSLSIKMQNDYRAVLASSWYRRIFPHTTISSQKNTENEVLLRARGGRLATSINGPLTGRGADILIIDDPLQANDAHSEAKRTSVNEWIGPTAMSRINDKQTGAVVVVAQRLHEDDLIGFLLRNDPGGWVHLDLPAIAEARMVVKTGTHTVFERIPGSVLHPAREPHETLQQIRRSLGEQAFEAQYQQRPTPPGGTVFKRKWLRHYDAAPIRESENHLYQSWDTASKVDSYHDYSVCTTWLLKDGSYYLVDLWRGRLEFTDLKRKAIELAQSFRADGVLVEDAGIGSGLISELRRAGISAIEIKPTDDKVTRAALRTPIFESARVWFPRHAPWLDALENELLSFPGGRHDDQVDSITQMLGYRPPVSTFRTIRF